MKLREAFEAANRKKKGLIISGEIGGRCGEDRLKRYIEKRSGTECEVTAETTGFVIVKELRR